MSENGEELEKVDRIGQINGKLDRVLKLIHMANPNLEDKMNLQMVQVGQQNIADTVNNLSETVDDLKEKVEALEKEIEEGEL